MKPPKYNDVESFDRFWADNIKVSAPEVPGWTPGDAAIIAAHQRIERHAISVGQAYVLATDPRPGGYLFAGCRARVEFPDLDGESVSRSYRDQLEHPDATFELHWDDFEGRERFSVSVPMRLVILRPERALSELLEMLMTRLNVSAEDEARRATAAKAARLAEYQRLRAEFGAEDEDPTNPSEVQS